MQKHYLLFFRPYAWTNFAVKLSSNATRWIAPMPPPAFFRLLQVTWTLKFATAQYGQFCLWISICKWKIMISPHRCFLLLVEVCPSEKLNDFCEKVHTVLLFATDEVACKEIWNCDVMLWMPSCLRIKNYLIVNFASSFALGFPVYWLQLLRCQWQASSVIVASSFLINSYCMSVKIRITRKNRWRYLVISKSGGGERGHRRSQGAKGPRPPNF